MHRLVSCVLAYVAAAGRAQVSKEGAEAAEAAKGSYGFGIGEEWVSWLPVTWGLRDFADSLDAGGAPAPNAATQRPDGQWVVDTFPLGCGRAIRQGTCLGSWSGLHVQPQPARHPQGPCQGISSCPVAFP